VNDSNQGFDTLRIHAGYNPDDHQHSATVPIYQNAAFTLGTAERGRLAALGKVPAYTYSRLMNPTVRAFEERVARLDGGVDAVAVASGMAAVTYAVLSLAEGAGRIVLPHDIYGASLDEFLTLFPKYGVDFDLVDDINDTDELRAAIRPDTKAVFVESITNPGTHVTDVDRVSAVAHDAGVPLIVDNTFPTPYLFRPIEHGADIVLYSSTKGLNGHGNAIGGVIVDAGRFPWDSPRFPQFTEAEFTLYDEDERRSRSFHEVYGDAAYAKRLRAKYLRLFGAVLGPQEAYLSLLGLETISERLDKEVRNATEIARYLKTNPHVTQLFYSGLEGDAQEALVARDFPKGIGAILAFNVEGGEPRVERIIDNTRVFSYLPNVGDVRSLIVNPIRITHREIPFDLREKDNIGGSTIRLSIGLEDVRDLIEDLDQAIAKAYLD
jgi:O-acetylhomoserine (thiol)-lyase